MVNMSVPYRRSCHSLTQLQDEIRDVWGGRREQNKGFVTGYKSPGNFSGHNASNLGITFAYDIGVDIEGDGTGLKPRDAEWLANYLRKEQNPRFAYLIYNRRIASNKTGFRWVPYNGASPHTDHIHISVLDLYWGNAVDVPAKVYDSRDSWGVAKAYRGEKADVKPAAEIDKVIKRPKKGKERPPKRGLYWAVEPGDTLTEIAAYYAVSVDELVRFNDIRNPDKIEVGDYIKIPAPLYWTVERGDSIEGIAAYYGMSYDAVAKNAGLVGKRPIIGTTIRVY